MSAPKDELLDEAADLVRTMTTLALEYQACVRAAGEDDGQQNLSNRLRLSSEYDALTPRTTQRKLEMAGFDAAASAVEDLRSAVFEVVGSWEMSMGDDDSHALSVNVEGKSDAAGKEIEGAREQQEPSISPDVVALLTQAALLADEIESLGSDFQISLDGCIPYPIDEDESDEERLQRLASQYGRIEIESVIGLLEKQGFKSAAQALTMLSDTVGRVVRSTDAEGDTKDDILALDLCRLRDDVIESLKRVRTQPET